MAAKPLSFDKRMRRIDRSYRRMRSNGYSVYVGTDGLIKRRPKAAPVRIPMSLVFVILVGFFLFKAMVIGQLGDAVYAERLVELSGGTMLERAGAWAMQIDPVTEFLVTKLQGFMG